MAGEEKPGKAAEVVIPLVHKVASPPRRNDFAELGSGLDELCFHDAPLEEFKDQSGRNKGLLGLTFVFPILDWVTTYMSQVFLADAVGGCTIANLAIPQDLGYAKLAGLPPGNGLYSSFIPPLVYSVLGSSCDIAIGTVAVVSLLSGRILKQEIGPTDNPDDYLQLAFTAKFFCGVFQTGLGIFRLGFVTEFLSHAAIAGFQAGAALIIALQQLKGLLNIAHFTTETDLISVMKSVFGHIDEWNWRSIVIGVAFLGFLLATETLGPKKQKLFWISAIAKLASIEERVVDSPPSKLSGLPPSSPLSQRPTTSRLSNGLAPLTSVILSTLFVFITRANRLGFKIVGHIKKGINPVSARQLVLSGSLAAAGATFGLIASLIARTEEVAIGRTFGALRDYHIDGNKEMIAFGVMNLCGSAPSCYIATSSFSRSAGYYQSGVNTVVSNVIMSLVVLITLLVLTPLFKFTPNTILSVIIISAVLSLIDWQAAWLLWKIDKFDFLACLGAFVGLCFVSVEIGLLIAVSISFFKILYNVTRPHTARLGNIPGTTVYRNVTQYPNATLVPGILAIGVGAVIYFSNSNYIHDKILHYLEEETHKLKRTGGARIQYFVVDLPPVTNIDTSGIIAFEEPAKTLKRTPVQLAFANPGVVLMHKLEDSQFLAHVGSEWVFTSVSEAIQVCTMLWNQAAAEGQV